MINKYFLGLGAGIIFIFILFYATGGFVQTGSVDDFFSGYGNVQSFQLTQDFGNMRCDEFNEIWVTYSNGNKAQLASFSDRSTIFIDSEFQNQLSLHVGGTNNVDKVHVKLFLECDGSAMEGSTLVSGSVKLRIKMESPEIFFIGTERPISVFGTQQIVPVTLQKDVKTEVFSYDITSSQIDNALNLNTEPTTSTSSKYFKSEMLPNLSFQFIHPSVGFFTGVFDSSVYGKPIISQFSFTVSGNGQIVNQQTVSSVDSTTDTDGDGIIDSVDNCPLLPETMNNYNDIDGCPDTQPDNDGDGIIDVNDACPLQPENINGVSDSDGCPDTNPNALDLDSDGIEDTLDECPQEKETVNGILDSDGCPDTNPNTIDYDGDGIPDIDDICPSEPETVNGVLDSDGCPDNDELGTLSSSEQSDLGTTEIIRFSGANNDDPSGIILIVIIFVGFIGAVIILNRRKK